MNLRFPSLRLEAFTARRIALCIGLIIASVGWFAASAQETTKPTSQTDSDTPPAAKPAHDSPSTDIDTAWSMLTSAVTDTKHPDLRIQALAALGNINANPRAAKLIIDAMQDPDVDIRTAAVLAAGGPIGALPSMSSSLKNSSFKAPLRALLDDKEPQVALAAATTLWKMGDKSGEDLLMAVIDGERKTGPGLISGGLHTANKDLHSPSTLARIGALQGASMLLGPFGFGITAFEYIHKNGVDMARPLAIELISHEKSKPVHDELVSALEDKDVGVRAAAAKALSEYHDKPTAAAIAELFYDSKPPVRLTAAAAYIRASGATESTARRPAKK